MCGGKNLTLTLYLVHLPGLLSPDPHNQLCIPHLTNYVIDTKLFNCQTPTVLVLKSRSDASSARFLRDKRRLTQSGRTAKATHRPPAIDKFCIHHQSGVTPNTNLQANGKTNAGRLLRTSVVVPKCKRLQRKPAIPLVRLAGIFCTALHPG